MKRGGRILAVPLWGTVLKGVSLRGVSLPSDLGGYKASAQLEVCLDLFFPNQKLPTALTN